MSFKEKLYKYGRKFKEKSRERIREAREEHREVQAVAREERKKQRRETAVFRERHRGKESRKRISSARGANLDMGYLFGQPVKKRKKQDIMKDLL